MATRRVGIGARLALLVGAVAFALGLGECGLAGFAPQTKRSPRVWQHDPDLGWAHRPGARGRLVSPEFDVEVVINAAGLRGPEAGIPTPAGVQRIAIFGDSFAMGWGVAESDSLRARLEAELRSGGAGVEVLSFGVAGYGTDQALLAYRTRGRRFAPDAICLVIYNNDLWDISHVQGNGGFGRGVPKPYFVLDARGSLMRHGVPVPRVADWDAPPFPSPAWLRRSLADIAQRSHIAALMRRAREDRSAAPTEYYRRFYAPAATEAPADAKAWAVLEALLGAFGREARAAGSRLLVLYTSDAIEVDANAWERARTTLAFADDFDSALPARKLAEIAARQAIEFIDLGHVMRADAGPEPFFFGEGHWNEAGHALAADALARKLGR